MSQQSLFPAPVQHRGGEGRTCTVCQQYKEAAAFSLKNGKLRPQCRACRAQQESERETRRKAAVYAQQAATPGETACCTQCGETKSVTAFHKSTGKSGRLPFCKTCRQQMYLGVGQTNEQGLLRCTDCGEYCLAEDFPKRGRCCKRCKSKRDAAYKADIKATNPQLLKDSARRYRAKHGAACTKRTMNWQRKQRRENPAFRVKAALMSRLRTAVAAAIDRSTKLSFSATQRTNELIGCTNTELVAHLEAQFQPGMSWDNHGLRGWHIDHKRPCASFDLTDPEQQRQCFHYSNLQPLWWWENLSKGARVAA